MELTLIEKLTVIASLHTLKDLTANEENKDLCKKIIKKFEKTLDKD